jgi:uncharacterized protein YfdQ (DUF2303 family)
MEHILTITQTAAELGAALAAPVDAHGGTPYVALPEGYSVHDLERLLPEPARHRGNVALGDCESFVAYVKRNATAETAIYGSLNPPGFQAVFNDHAPGLPGWRDHTAAYSCPLSVEWKTWAAVDGSARNQADFATFIEDNAPDLVSPPAADMLEIARTLEAKKKVNFASAVRLDNGQVDFTFEEQIEGTAAKGKLQIPQTFTIGIPVLEGGPRYAVTARLRYRIGDKGALTLWYDLERPHKTMEAAAKEVWAAIKDGTGLPMFNGK